MTREQLLENIDTYRKRSEKFDLDWTDIVWIRHIDGTSYRARYHVLTDGGLMINHVQFFDKDANYTGRFHYGMITIHYENIISVVLIKEKSMVASYELEEDKVRNRGH